MAVKFFNKSSFSQGMPKVSRAFDSSPGVAYEIDYLLVAGGGSSVGNGAASGAGGLLQGVQTVNARNSYAFVVGPAGVGNANGSNTTGFALTAIGGGRGGANGGSGGSGNHGSAIGLGTAGQGFNGGTGGFQAAVSGASGGGGGSAGVGTSTNQFTGGAGGPGTNWKSLGVTYAIGGTGGSNNGGGSTASGYGHGGGSQQSGTGGIVIVRYAGTQRGTGGTVTSGGGFTYHTFTANGTFVA
jgi:hypothetical protein